MGPQPSGKAVKKAGKAQKAVRATDKKGKHKKRRKESFSIYIYKVIVIKFLPSKCLRVCPTGAKAGPSRHWYLIEGDVNYEFVRKRHLRTHRRRGLPFGPL